MTWERESVLRTVHLRVLFYSQRGEGYKEQSTGIQILLVPILREVSAFTGDLRFGY
jgi:hypothetical protein